MAKLVYKCDFCHQCFSTQEEAEAHEKLHYKKCGNPNCQEKIFVKDVVLGNGKKYCSRKCGNYVKVNNFRDRQKIDYFLS